MTTSFRLGRKHIGPALSLLAQRYPALDITLDAVDRRVDLINESIDLDVRVGEAEEPHLVAHRIADGTRHQTFGVWRLAGPHGAAKVKVTGRLSSNNAEIVRGWANDGHGILLASRWDVHADLVAGRLVPVLPACSQSADIWAASTVRLSHSAKVRVCVRFLQQQLASGPFALRQ